MGKSAGVTSSLERRIERANWSKYPSRADPEYCGNEMYELLSWLAAIGAPINLTLTAAASGCFVVCAGYLRINMPDAVQDVGLSDVAA